MPVFSASTSATKRAIPASPARERELLEQARADPAALLLVGDGERDLGGRGVAQARVARERDDRARAVRPRERADERAALGPVGVEERLDEPAARRGRMPWKRR